jgi:predicted aspartyl protease
MKHEMLIERKRIIVFAQMKGVNDTLEFRFILDTGSSITIIDEQVATTLGFDLKRLKTGDRLMTAGGGTNSKILKLPKFSLFGKDMINFEVSVLNLPPQITYFVDGLIGMDFLLQFKNIKFDFDEKTIET